VEVEKAARAQFQVWLESTMRGHYMVAADEDPEGELWSVRDIGAKTAPSQATAVPYRARFAFFPSIDEVASDLVQGPYLEIGGRILAQFSGKAGDKRGE